MPDYLGDQIDEFKVSNPIIDQFTENQIFECKVEKDMLDHLIDVYLTELMTDVGPSCLRNNKFGSGVIGLNPEVVTIQVGEDVATKVMSFSGNGCGVCIMSAHGAVSNVTVRQGASSHETISYEGYFEIMSLSGSYQQSKTHGMRSRKGGLVISLAGLNGCIFGGGVAGPLTAASPVQVVIGRFPVDEKKKLKRSPGASSSTPRVALNGSSGWPTSAPNQSASGSFNTNNHTMFSNI